MPGNSPSQPTQKSRKSRKGFNRFMKFTRRLHTYLGILDDDSRTPAQIRSR